MRPIIHIIALSLIMTTSAAQAAESQSFLGYNLRLSVPVTCQLSHQPGLTAVGRGYQLGELREYCNAPSGYALYVNYAPGTMRGAEVSVGEERVVLDGSGHTMVGRATGPRIRDRPIYAEPGPAGFDTDRLNFDIAMS